MKLKNLFLLLSTLTLLFTACSDEKDTPPTATGDGLPGSWQLVAVDYTETRTTQNQGETATEEANGWGTDMEFELLVSENPDQLTTSGTYFINLTENMFGTPLTRKIAGENFLSEGSWQLADSTLTITSADNNVRTIFVERVDEEKLILEYGETVTTNGMNGTVTVASKGVYEFERK